MWQDILEMLNKMKKKFKVTAVYTSYCTAEIEAESEEQAYEIAQDMDGGLFDPIGQGDDSWRIYDVEEFKE